MMRSTLLVDTEQDIDLSFAAVTFDSDSGSEEVMTASAAAAADTDADTTTRAKPVATSAKDVRRSVDEQRFSAGRGSPLARLQYSTGSVPVAGKGTKPRDVYAGFKHPSSFGSLQQTPSFRSGSVTSSYGGSVGVGAGSLAGSAQLSSTPSRSRRRRRNRAGSSAGSNSVSGDGAIKAAAFNAVNTATLPTATLVLTNLPYALQRDELHARCSAAAPTVPEPQSIVFREKKDGSFSGMAFVDYGTIEDAKQAMKDFSALRVEGREIRIEYKRAKRWSSGDAGSDESDKDGSGRSRSPTGSAEPLPETLVDQQLRMFRDGAQNSFEWPLPISSAARMMIQAKAQELGLLCQIRSGQVRVFKEFGDSSYPDSLSFGTPPGRTRSGSQGRGKEATPQLHGSFRQRAQSTGPVWRPATRNGGKGVSNGSGGGPVRNLYPPSGPRSFGFNDSGYGREGGCSFPKAASHDVHGPRASSSVPNRGVWKRDAPGTSVGKSPITRQPKGPTTGSGRGFAGGPGARLRTGNLERPAHGPRFEDAEEAPAAIAAGAEEPVDTVTRREGTAAVVGLRPRSTHITFPPPLDV